MARINKINIEVNGKEDYYSYLDENFMLSTYISVGYPTKIGMYSKHNHKSTGRKIDFSDITKITLVGLGITINKNKLFKEIK